MTVLSALKNIGKLVKNLTISEGKSPISETREVSTRENRDTGQGTGSANAVGNSGTATGKPIVDTFSCPYCQSKNFVRRGLRIKKCENVQLYLCKDCKKTFTPHSIRGKHYPLATIFDAISLYNLGYSLEESCRKTNSAVSGSATAVSNSGTGAGNLSSLPVKDPGTGKQIIWKEKEVMVLLFPSPLTG